MLQNKRGQIEPSLLTLAGVPLFRTVKQKKTFGQENHLIKTPLYSYN